MHHADLYHSHIKTTQAFTPQQHHSYTGLHIRSTPAITIKLSPSLQHLARTQVASRLLRRHRRFRRFHRFCRLRLRILVLPARANSTGSTASTAQTSIVAAAAQTFRIVVGAARAVVGELVQAEDDLAARAALDAHLAEVERYLLGGERWKMLAHPELREEAAERRVELAWRRGGGGHAVLRARLPISEPQQS